MTKRDNERLFDITTRLALFVEGIKLWQMAEFNAVLAAVDEELRRLLGRVEVKTMDGLSKAELNRLLLSLRRAQSQVYTAYTAKLIGSLEQFMRVRLDVGAIAYASAKFSFLANPGDEPFTQDTFTTLSEAKAYAFIESQSEKETFAPLFGLGAILGGGAGLWSTIKNAPIPANGSLLLPFVQTFARSAQASVENTVRKAYANRQSVAETLAEISGKRTAQGNSTQFAKIKAQADAVIETAFAHVDQISSQAIVSALFARYQWLSVIDGSTTTVCRERDEKIFRYGQGPVPPAHYKCRSITVPLASLFGDFKPPTLYAWLKRQPHSVLVDIVGKTVADLFKSGDMTAKEFGRLTIGSPSPINQFKSKLALILST